MKNTKNLKAVIRIAGIIAIGAVIGLSLAGCETEAEPSSGNKNNGVTLPKNSGTNEVVGKTLYLNSWSKIVFAATGTTYKSYYKDYDDEGYNFSYELHSEGKYSYNSDTKTISLAVEYIYYIDGTKMSKSQMKSYYGKSFDDSLARMNANFNDMVLQMAVQELPEYDDFYDDYWDYEENGGTLDEDGFLKQWLTQKGYDSNTLISKWKSDNPSRNTPDKYIDALVKDAGCKNLAEYKAFSLDLVANYRFSLTTYDYQFATDGTLLVQGKLPANKGSNELQGKTFTDSYDDDVSYTFASSGNTYSKTDNYYGQTVTGTYAYDSSERVNSAFGQPIGKMVWFKPEKIDGMTMLEYYEDCKDWGDSKEEAAGETNSAFGVYSTNYNLNTNGIGW